MITNVVITLGILIAIALAAAVEMWWKDRKADKKEGMK